jgi:hypothetical protein
MSIGGNLTISGLAAIIQYNNEINTIILLRIVYFRNFDKIDTFYDELFLDKRIFYRNYFQEILLPDEYKVDHGNPKQLFSYDCNEKRIYKIHINCKFEFSNL